MKGARVAIVMGSSSDAEVMQESARVLRELGVDFEMGIYSAHRTPGRALAFASGAASRGVRVVIAGAGAAAHLAGMLAAHTRLPVIGVPLASTALSGLDALFATVQMPAGFPVATMAIGKAGAQNAAFLAAEILALQDEELGARIDSWRRRKASEVEAASQELSKKAGS